MLRDEGVTCVISRQSCKGHKISNGSAGLAGFKKARILQAGAYLMVEAQHHVSNVRMKTGHSKSKQIEHKCLFFVLIKGCLSDIKKKKEIH